MYIRKAQGICIAYRCHHYFIIWYLHSSCTVKKKDLNKKLIPKITTIQKKVNINKKNFEFKNNLVILMLLTVNVCYAYCIA